MKFPRSPAGLLWLLCSTAVAYPSLSTHGDEPSLHVRQTDSTTTNEYTIELPLDHRDPSAGTFKNRYFINDTFFEEGGPIIVLDKGEAGWDPAELSASKIMTYAETFKGLAIGWEHRYYGKSLPEADFNTSDGSDPEKLGQWYKHHTFENALEDLAAFAKNFTWNGKDYSPGKESSWVMMGGSYPGTRVAYMLVSHPDVFDFGLASSAPVQWKVDFWEYWAPIERAMVKNNLGSCGQAVNTVAKWLDQAYDDGNTKAFVDFLTTFNTAWGTPEGAPSSDTSLDDLADIISLMWRWPFNNFQYASVYSTTAYVGIADFCSYFQSGAGTTVLTEASEAGTGVSDETMALLYAKAAGDIYSKQAAVPVVWPQDALSWTYQTCHEAGVFQTGNASRDTNIVPAFMSVDLYIRDCKRNFGSSVSKEALLKNNEKLVKQYQGWDLQLDNILWTNGEYDPWRFLTGDTDLEEHGGRKWTPTSKIPQCGAKLPEGTQLSYTIKEGVHCNDLNTFIPPPLDTSVATTDPATGINLTLQPPISDIENAWQLWSDLMAAWLKKGCAPPKQPMPVIKDEENVKSGSGSKSGSQADSKSASTRFSPATPMCYSLVALLISFVFLG